MLESRAHKALSNETRLQILHILYKSSLSVEEIAKETTLQPVTVRHHLRTLEEAGLITQKEVRTGGSGRPRLKYEIVREIPQVDFPRRQYLALSNFFIRVAHFLLGEKRAVELFQKVGHEMGSNTVKKLADKYEVEKWSLDSFREFFIERYLKESGSEPEIVERGKSSIVYRLHNCIFFELALDKPEIVCDLLHDSFSEGVAEGLGGKAKFKRPKCLARGDTYCEHAVVWLS